ncbi:hypothetical protein GSY71_15540 [Pusillimonas sp. TS35]|uniref:hypothetical protein n=1 Tax=Paracandidimonas lactea TaxID=2895524 RepID=UPI00136B517E|nr:hypothetical protein [Paracandidimonas lactea]MYN14551.1 hypothetical protein [Pusillimonas sp. TS35]
MRFFDLFMRRVGVRPAPARVPNPVSRFTVVCPRHLMADVRRQIYLDFEAAGLRVSGLRVDNARQHDMARACVTVDCPPDKRGVLMSQARQLRAFPGVQQVHWGDRSLCAVN